MKWIVVPILGVMGLLALLWVFQRSLIYFPTAQLEPPDPVSEFEEVTLETDDGLTLDAWHFPTNDAAATVIVFNGNAGNRSHRLPLATALADRGLGVLAVDYRGYGGNPGSPTEEGLYADARAARGFLHDADIDTATIVYFGESLGAAVALQLAREYPPAALILRSPFTSLADVGAVHYPFLPASLLLRDEFSNLSKVADLDSPLLVIAGSDDEIIPTSQSRDVWEAAPGPKRLVVIDGASHNDFELLTGEEMVDAIGEFIGAHVGG